MPGVVVFRRRWGVGSDDLVVPGVFLCLMHLIWIVVLGIILALVEFDTMLLCKRLLLFFIVIYLTLLSLAFVTELIMSCVSLRGGILNTAPRAPMEHILYVRFSLLLVEVIWLTVGIVWLYYYYKSCDIDRAKQAVLGAIVCNWCIQLSIVITVWCTYDSAGRSWVRMKQYQRSMRESESRHQYKRSGSTRNWRQRKVIREYQDSWDQRCRFLFCCIPVSDRNRNSFTEIARLLSEFFRDLDVVPSDVVAGLILLRKFQQIERKAIVEQRTNDTIQFLSGVPVTARTRFLALKEHGRDLELFESTIHYAHYAVRAYGWPMYAMAERCGMCALCWNLKCGCCCGCRKAASKVEVVEDNCCQCNYATLETLSQLGEIEIVYATYHVDVGETPFFIAIDYDLRKIVLSVRGTLSMKDVLTDLNAEPETLPLSPPREDFLGHKGMANAAQYILNKIRAEGLVQRAFEHNVPRGTRQFGLVIVGHSLGAGTASILGILMREEYPELLCYCYSPPGGLLSMAAMEYTKQFTISVVMGKDVVPRIGLNQMEALRADLINAIKRSVDPKWKIIFCGVACRCCTSPPTSATRLSTMEDALAEYIRAKTQARTDGAVHPSDTTISLTSHQPMYPPGRIIHIVRHHENQEGERLGNKEPIHQALWAQNTDFDEVLISPVMIQDHMPDKVLSALKKVVIAMGPKKPPRSTASKADGSAPTTPPSLLLETSFTGADEQPFRHVRQHLAALHDEDRTRKIDLLHDDWLGLAPLARPESYSDTSSVSSRSSSVATLQRHALKTPKMMRRTPRIIGNLSTCADDIRNVRSYERGGAGTVGVAAKNDSSNSSSGSNWSFVSASSDRVACRWRKAERATCAGSNGSDDFQSAEEILDDIIASAGCSDYFNSSASDLEGVAATRVPDIRLDVTHARAHRDDPDMVSNFAIDLNLERRHRSLQYSHWRLDALKPIIASGHLCRTLSDSKTVTFNPEIVSINEVLITRSPNPSPSCCGGGGGGGGRHNRTWYRLLELVQFRRRGERVESGAGATGGGAMTTHVGGATMTHVGGATVPGVDRERVKGCAEERAATSDAFPLLSALGRGARPSPHFATRRKVHAAPITESDV